MHADIIVIGGGLAGMQAALAAEAAGARVLLLARGPIGTGSNSALSNGAFAGPAAPGLEGEYVDLVMRIGCGINRRAYVERVAAEAGAAIDFLRSLDLPVLSGKGQWAVRSPRPGIIPGMALTRRVAALVLRRERIRVEAGVHVTGLERAPGRVTGVRCFTLRGEEGSRHAAALVLACGGAGAVYAKHDNQVHAVGSGYRLAAEAGLDLWDMEFVQLYPVVLDEPGWPGAMIYPPYPPEATLRNASGADVIRAHGLGDINQAIVRKRDTFSALLAEEAKAGPVCMDLRDVPAARWEAHPLSLLRRFQAVCAARPVRIAPAVHFCMGGVRTDENGQTDLGGLFACGEVVWGLHGANRMGGNALLECLVSGRIAGRAAARVAASAPAPAGEVGASPAARAGAPVDLRRLRVRLADVAWRCAGMVRSAHEMRAGLSEAEQISRDVQEAATASLRERILRHDLLSAAFSVRSVLAAGLGRQESRGCFLRSDYPARDDAAWLVNSRLRWTPETDTMTVEYRPAEA
jgi:succinate dehydrogenase/fumarate reductase flavoprotein subunit